MTFGFFYAWYRSLKIAQAIQDSHGRREEMETMPRFLRRLGPDPHSDGARTIALRGCPDIFELDSGDFAIIGIDITSKALPHLPPTAGCGPDERIVLVPRKTLVLAKSDIPNKI